MALGWEKSLLPVLRGTENNNAGFCSSRAKLSFSIKGEKQKDKKNNDKKTISDVMKNRDDFLPLYCDKTRTISWGQLSVWDSLRNGLIWFPGYPERKRQKHRRDDVWEALCKQKETYCFPGALDCRLLSLEQTGDDAYPI